MGKGVKKRLRWLHPGISQSIGSPRLKTIIEPGVTAVSCYGCKSRHHMARPDFFYYYYANTVIIEQIHSIQWIEVNAQN